MSDKRSERYNDKNDRRKNKRRYLTQRAGKGRKGTKEEKTRNFNQWTDQVHFSSFVPLRLCVKNPFFYRSYRYIVLIVGKYPKFASPAFNFFLSAHSALLLK